ncbi:unnamed protein product [Caenorhabditis sp. 36 PRJEB53466]|nr:unnamed protein product [Caenorhabditis sp. 36 PRJEB53466]
MSKSLSSSSNLSNSNTKTRSNEEADGIELKKCTSDASINNERMFASLEELMTYIGSRYPHFRKTVLPIVLVYTFLYFFSRFLSILEQMKALRAAKNDEYFYSKCLAQTSDDSLKVVESADFMVHRVPSWELSIVINAFLMFAFTTVSPRKLVLCSLAIISCCYFVMAHFPAQMQMSTFLSQILTEIYRMTALVTIAESVPKYHRMPALVLLEMAATIARLVAVTFVRLPADISLDLSYCFEIFGFLTLVLAFFTFYTFNDSLYSLLARSKTAEMQSRVTEVFRHSAIRLAPDAVIDQIAFENFENNENAIEILTRTLKTFKLIQEVLVCGLLSGACLAVNAFMEAEIDKHAEVFFFENALVAPVSFTAATVLISVFAVLLPRHRILPVIIIVPLLFFAASVMFVIPTVYKTYDKCSKHWVVQDAVFPYYLVVGVFTSALTDVITFFVRVHLLEVMPVLIRTAILAVLYFLQYSFDGNVRELYSTNSVGGSAMLILISVISMLVLLITPRKRNDMNVYFCEYTRNDKKRSIPPAPEIVK